MPISLRLNHTYTYGVAVDSVNTPGSERFKSNRREKQGNFSCASKTTLLRTRLGNEQNTGRIEVIQITCSVQQYRRDDVTGVVAGDAMINYKLVWYLVAAI